MCIFHVNVAVIFTAVWTHTKAERRPVPHITQREETLQKNQSDTPDKQQHNVMETD